MLAGAGVARDQAMASLLRFSERLEVPVATTFLGKGVFPDDHPNALGTIGFMVKDYANFGFDRADVVVAVGYDLVEYAPSRRNPARDKQECARAPDGRPRWTPNYTLAVGLQGSIGENLDGLPRSPSTGTRTAAAAVPLVKKPVRAATWSRGGGRRLPSLAGPD